MSRIAPPAEKIMATGTIYRLLLEELPPVSLDSPHVQAALIDAAVRLAMSTDTRDMGILVGGPLTDLAAGDHFVYPEDAVDPTGGHLGDLDPEVPSGGPD